MKRTRSALIATLGAATLAVAACGGDGEEGGGGGEAGAEAAATGPINIWYSNNQEEVAWGEQMVEAWNAEHPDEQITAEEIPAGASSEEAIGAAITAGNAPCLIFNTAPAAVPQFQKQGGLVALDDFEGAADYIAERTGDRAEQYKSPDGMYYQMPWKANPVMIFYNKALFTKAGLDAENPPLSTYEEFLETARTLVSSGAAPYAIWPAPTSEFFQSWFDFYPMFAAETGGTLLVEDGESQFTGEEGMAVAELWKTLYAEKLASQEQYNGDSFADAQAAMATVGPWAIPVYGDVIDWGAVPVPTSGGTAPEETWTFSDAKNIGLYTACENPGTAWEVLKFATSEEQDGLLLEMTGQMPMRQGLQEAYPDYFTENPAHVQFADQADRTIEVPNVPNSVEIWQTFRDAYSEAVIFGEGDLQAALDGAAEEINQLASQS
ncbi:MAG TPA: extracellular solute-binding protein [Jiangellaceae bacterium]|jgi:multiple sugar transport system substrate-binding protein|nr:extracellular solute-binding protein [Jiangellaceae bacterium]